MITTPVKAIQILLQKRKHLSATPPAPPPPPPPSQAVIKAQEEQKSKMLKKLDCGKKRSKLKRGLEEKCFKVRERERAETERRRRIASTRRKRIAKAKQEEQERLAREAEEKSKELEEKKVGLRQQLTLDHYPLDCVIASLMETQISRLLINFCLSMYL